MYLAKSNFAENRAVSFVGYSLGTVVGFNCLKMLKRMSDYKDLKVSRLINDVQLWAGAYVVDLNKDY